MNTLELEPPIAPRAPACLSEYALWRLHHGEVTGAEADRQRAHVAACPGCGAAFTALRAEVPPKLDFPGDVLRPARRPTGATKWLWLATGLAGGVAATLVAPQLGERRKGAGDWELSLVVQRGQVSERVLPGETLAPGDRVRFEVTAPRPGHVAIISADSRGAVTAFAPARGTLVPVGAGERQLLAGTVELDDALGAERVFLVACRQPTNVAALLAAATARLGAAGGDVSKVSGIAPEGCEEKSVLVQKASR